jgi:hypothetical protein
MYSFLNHNCSLKDDVRLSLSSRVYLHRETEQRIIDAGCVLEILDGLSTRNLVVLYDHVT